MLPAAAHGPLPIAAAAVTPPTNFSSAEPPPSSMVPPPPCTDSPPFFAEVASGRRESATAAVDETETEAAPPQLRPTREPLRAAGDWGDEAGWGDDDGCNDGKGDLGRIVTVVVPAASVRTGPPQAEDDRVSALPEGWLVGRVSAPPEGRRRATAADPRLQPPLPLPLSALRRAAGGRGGGGGGGGGRARADLVAAGGCLQLPPLLPLAPPPPQLCLSLSGVCSRMHSETAPKRPPLGRRLLRRAEAPDGSGDGPDDADDAQPPDGEPGAADFPVRHPLLLLPPSAWRAALGALRTLRRWGCAVAASAGELDPPLSSPLLASPTPMPLPPLATRSSDAAGAHLLFWSRTGLALSPPLLSSLSSPPFDDADVHDDEEAEVEDASAPMPHSCFC